MGLSKMSQLSANSWIYSNDPLMKSYREYTASGKEGSKGKLALSATIHAVKSVAYSVLSTFGLIIYMASAGHLKNHPWQYTRLHAEMTSASVRALFHFKPVMEEMRIAEAKGFCHALGHGNQLAIVTVIKAPKGIDLLAKLKGLNAAQLGEVLPKVPRGSVQSESAFLQMLHRLRQETTDPAKASLLDQRIQSIQANLHRESGLIVCRYPGQDGICIALLREKRKEAFQQVFPELRPRLERLDAAQGIEVTQDQYALCMGLGPVFTHYKPNDPALPSPAMLHEMAKAAIQHKWGDARDNARIACELYGSIMDGRTFTAEEYTHLFKAASALDVFAIMRKSMIYRDHNIAKTPQEKQQLAQQAFEMLKTKGSQLTVETAEDCLRYLLDDASMQWMPDQAQDTDSVVIGINKIHWVTPNTDWAARFIENSLAAGKLALLNQLMSLGRYLVRPQDEERVVRAWQQCSDQNVRLAAMPALYALGWQTQYGTAQRWPRLNDLLFQHASNPANLAVAREACEKVLCLQFDKTAVQGTYGHANINLKPLVLQRLPLASQHGLQKLRDNCIDIILTNVGQFSAIWLNEQPDLIADALSNTERKADWNRDRPASQLACAKEGLALLQYANAHPNTPLADAARQYLLRNPNNAAYLTAVQGLGAQERANFRLLEEMYH